MKMKKRIGKNKKKKTQQQQDEQQQQQERWWCTGKTVVVTGATSGIGRETAIELVNKGAHVVLAVRDGTQGEEVCDDVEKKKSGKMGGKVVLGPELDLSKEESVRKFAKEYIKGQWPLHALVNNAAVGAGAPQWVTPESGVVGLVQVNYLGPYLLTRLLEEKLVQSAPSKVVNVSSIMHRLSTYDTADGFLKSYEEGTYANTKYANVLFTSELNQRWKGRGVTACAVDPGGVVSSIWRHSVFSKPPMSWLMGLVYAPTYDGASAVVHAVASDHEVDAPAQRKVLSSVKKRLSLPEVPDFRLYARGAFAWPTLTKTMPGTQQKQKNEKMRGYGVRHKVAVSMMSVNCLLHSLLDWPLRRLSFSLLAAQTCPVQANLSSYNRKISKELWEKSAELMKLPM